MEAVHTLRVMWKHKLLSACSAWHYTAVDGDCIAYVAQCFMLMGQVGVPFYLSKMCGCDETYFLCEKNQLTLP